ncbi:MAG: hypothetical protein ACREBP_04010, partial [Sphingomicrobium sp.]
MNKLALTTALATIAALSATPAAAQYTRPVPPPMPEATAQPAQPAAPAAQPGQIKLSREAGKAIIELQKAVNANDTANIPAKLSAAQALAKTPDDRYAIGQLQLKAAVAANNDEASSQAIDYIAAANFLPAAQVASLYNSLGVKFFNAKNAPRATQMFQKALTVDPTNAESQRLLAESQMAANPAAAISAMKKAITQAAASGQRLPEDSYKRAVKAAYDAKSQDAVEISRAWVAAYPSAESWKNAVAIYRNMMRPEVQGTLDLLRLLRAANALGSSGDYTLFATAASEQGNFGEAKSVIDEGVAAKKVDPKSSLASDIINGLKSKPMATAADIEAAAKAAKTAGSMVTVGNRFYGIGNYARAAELYRAAAGAGGDTGLANLHLGMALARSGDKAGATAALKA